MIPGRKWNVPFDPTENVQKKSRAVFREEHSQAWDDGTNRVGLHRGGPAGFGDYAEVH